MSSVWVWVLHQRSFLWKTNKQGETLWACPSLPYSSLTPWLEDVHASVRVCMSTWLHTAALPSCMEMCTLCGSIYVCQWPPHVNSQVTFYLVLNEGGLGQWSPFWYSVTTVKGQMKILKKDSKPHYPCQSMLFCLLDQSLANLLFIWYWLRKVLPIMAILVFSNKLKRPHENPFFIPQKRPKTSS